MNGAVNWAKAITGVIAILLGLIWIGQGLNLIHGSGMSGHGQFAVLGVVVALFGAWLLASVLRTRARIAGR